MPTVPVASSTPLSEPPTLWVTASGGNPHVTAQQQQQRPYHNSQSQLHLPYPQLHHSTPVYPPPAHPFPPFHSESGLPRHQQQYRSYNSLLPGRYEVDARPIQKTEGLTAHGQTLDIRTQSVPHLYQQQDRTPLQYSHHQSEYHYPTLSKSVSFGRTHLQTPAIHEITSRSHDGFLRPYDNSGPQPPRSHSDSEMRQYGPSYVAQSWQHVGQTLNGPTVQRSSSEYALQQPRTYPRQSSYPYALDPPYPSGSYASQPYYGNDMRSQASSTAYQGPVQVVLQDYSGQQDQSQYPQLSETARTHRETGSQMQLDLRQNQPVGDFYNRTMSGEDYDKNYSRMSMPVKQDNRTPPNMSMHTTEGYSNPTWPGTQPNMGRMPMEYRMVVRQHPKQTRVVNPNDKAIDRKSIDPPPIVQLEFTDRNANEESFLQNPYLFCYASLVPCSTEEKDVPGSDIPIDRRPNTLSEDLMGSLVSSLHKLKNTENQDGGYFIFPNMYVRAEGIFRLCLSLFDIKGMKVSHITSVFTNTFVCYSSQTFPGVAPSTFLSRSFSDQGVRIKIRKEHRVQLKRQSKIKRDIANMNKSVNEQESCSSQSNSTCGSSDTRSGTNTPRGEADGEAGPSKRSRTMDGLSYRGSQHNNSSNDSMSSSNDSVETMGSMGSGTPLRTFLFNAPSSFLHESGDTSGGTSPLRSSFVREQYHRLSLKQADQPKASSSYSQEKLRSIQPNTNARHWAHEYPEYYQHQHQHQHQNQHQHQSKHQHQHHQQQLHHSTGSLDKHPTSHLTFNTFQTPNVSAEDPYSPSRTNVPTPHFWPRPHSGDGTPVAYTNVDTVQLPPLRPKPSSPLPHERIHEG